MELAAPPSATTTSATVCVHGVQEGLSLQPQQEQQILGARRNLLQRLAHAQELRLAAYSALRDEAQVWCAL